MVEDADHGGPRGAPPRVDLPDAFQELLTNLYYANQVFEEKEDAGREGIAIACHAVARLIAVTHHNPALVAPFLALRAALLDLKKGIGNPIIDPAAVNGSRSRSALKKHAITTASVCLEVLVELGDPLEEAASRVARLVGQWRIMGDQQVSATTLKNWRTQQRALPPDQRNPFDLMRGDLLKGPDTRERTEVLLKDGPLGIPKT